MNAIPFRIPAEFANPAVYERIGAIIRNRASGEIAGHVQELAGWSRIAQLPIPGANPLALVGQAVQSVQLQQIQNTLNTVQTLATVGAVASVASLGVSVGGFAAVLAKLKRMDGKLDQLLSSAAKVRQMVEQLRVRADAIPVAVLQSRLEELSMAWHYDGVRRRDSLRDSIEKLSELRHYYALLLSSEEFCALGTENLGAILDAEERLVAACSGELLAELMLSGDPGLVSKRWQLQQELRDGIAWKDGQALYRLAEQGDRMTGVHLVTLPGDRRARVDQVQQIRSESEARIASIPHLATFLAERGVGLDDYVAQLQLEEKRGEPLLVACVN